MQIKKRLRSEFLSRRKILHKYVEAKKKSNDTYSSIRFFFCCPFRFLFKITDPNFLQTKYHITFQIQINFIKSKGLVVGQATFKIVCPQKDNCFNNFDEKLTSLETMKFVKKNIRSNISTTYFSKVKLSVSQVSYH